MELNLRNRVKFTTNHEDKNWSSYENCVGGIINEGELEWIARGSVLEIYSSKTGALQYHYCFEKGIFSLRKGAITCVEEFSGTDFDGCLLAIGIQFEDPPHGMIVLFSVNKWMIVRCINLNYKISSCKFLDTFLTRHSIVKMFRECLAVGTEAGEIVLLDICPKDFEETIFDYANCMKDVCCNIVSSLMVPEDILRNYEESVYRREDFGIIISDVNDPTAILCLVPTTQLMALVIGCQDGRMIFYNMANLTTFNIILPKERNAPLFHAAFVEPVDDPRAYTYIWALHGSRQKPLAIMHSILYLKKSVEPNGLVLYHNFQTSSRVLEITSLSNDIHTHPIGCQSIMQPNKLISLCFLGWRIKDGIELLLFDINQWYKENMPKFVDVQSNPNFLVPFFSRNCNFVLDFCVNEETIKEFRWLQRPEEYCFPISLSFDCLLLQRRGSAIVNWAGLQRCALNMLENGGPLAFLDPDPYFSELMKASLIPQNCEYDLESDLQLEARREILLSIALEYECSALLRECVNAWSDGSHFRQAPFKGLSLSTLTEWIWRRAKVLTDRCSAITVPLFDDSGMSIGETFRKTLLQTTWQLKFLSILLNDILRKCKDSLPTEVFHTLSTQRNLIDMIVKYQEIAQWFEKIGLLPEHKEDTHNKINGNEDSQKPVITYLYKRLHNYYVARRMEFKNLSSDYYNLTTGSCRMLYIDAFIERECNWRTLRTEWVNCGGDGLYPPPSLQAMLRLLLVPDVRLEKKYELFTYFFLDLSANIRDEYDGDVVQKLINISSTFGQNPFVRNTIKAYWDLDHGRFKDIWYAIPSPPQHRRLLSWEIELLLEALLIQDQPKFACHILYLIRTSINPLLELKIYLANNSLTEAFSFVRSKGNLNLLREFFKHCLNLGKCEVLSDLFLTEQEEDALQKLIDDLKSPKACNVYLAYLLRKSDFFKAGLYFKKLNFFCNRKENIASSYLEIANDLLTLYKKTMTPHTRKLFDHHLRNCNIDGVEKEMTNNILHLRKPIKISSKGQQYFENNLEIINNTPMDNHRMVASLSEEKRMLRIPIIKPVSENNIVKSRRTHTNVTSVSSILKTRNAEVYSSPFKKLHNIEEIDQQKLTRFHLSKSSDTVYEDDAESTLLGEEDNISIDTNIDKLERNNDSHIIENDENDKQSTRSQSRTEKTRTRRKVKEPLATPRRSLRPRRTSTSSVESSATITPLRRSKRRLSTSTDG